MGYAPLRQLLRVADEADRLRRPLASLLDPWVGITTKSAMPKVLATNKLVVPSRSTTTKAASSSALSIASTTLSSVTSLIIVV
jgi:hypothetical protein